MNRLRKISTAKRIASAAALLGVLGAGTGFAIASSSTTVPTPTITAWPANPTTSTSASLSFTDSQQNATFICSLDGGAYASCKSPAKYSVTAGDHTFSVKAQNQNGSGNPSTAATYVWHVDALNFSISGSAPPKLYPGATPQALNLNLYNPNTYSIPVLSLTVAVTVTAAPNATVALPCAASDFTTLAYSGPGFTLPPGTSTLSGLAIPSTTWPKVGMVNKTTNQDGCKGASLSLAYTGSGHS